jgi:heme-degrading monooxygenase HmoA
MNIYGTFFLRLKVMALAAILLTGSAEAKVILINLFEVPQGKEKEAISMWETARDFLKTQPGYITTQLHEAFDEASQFKLINIAEWDSIDNFKKATEAMNKSGKVPMVEGVKGNPSLYKVIRTDK